ncbi:MAG: hypothetical protein AAF215_23905 [Cyanobacteria bacterium P01_A01_bin.123]
MRQFIKRGSFIGISMTQMLAGVGGNPNGNNQTAKPVVQHLAQKALGCSTAEEMCHR